jgi:hypothetical protein
MKHAHGYHPGQVATMSNAEAVDRHLEDHPYEPPPAVQGGTSHEELGIRRSFKEIVARLEAQIPILDRIIVESRERAAYLRGLIR